VTYRISNSALNTLTRIVAQKLAGTGILVNAASPGKVNTGMALPGEKTVEPEQAAADMAWLTTLPDNGPTGGFWYGTQSLSW